MPGLGLRRAAGRPARNIVADRSANGNGWYAHDVTVSYTCADQATLSGILSCSPSQSFTEGRNQTATGTAKDNAGNRARRVRCQTRFTVRSPPSSTRKPRKN